MAKDANRENDWSRQDVFTTGQVARICKVSQQTVIRNFDDGRLQGFKVPGSKFRRIPREALIQFMKENTIPLDRLNETGKHRVLVVDDEDAIVEMLEDFLERNGRFTVESARTGFEAGLQIKEFSPDVVVLDYLLNAQDGTDKGVNGDEVIKGIRENPSSRDIKIIVISGEVGHEQVQELLELGANAYLQKPFDLKDLAGLVSELVGV